MADATFEEGKDKPLHIKAMDVEELQIVSALIQDAILPVQEMKWDRKARRFGMLINRYRWELNEGSRPERVRTMLTIEDVQSTATLGFDRTDPDLVLSLLSISATETEDGQARIELTLAGDGGIAFEVEALEVTLRDVTRPYFAPSGRRPEHV